MHLRVIVCLLVISGLTKSSFSQPLPDSINKKIDALFQEWNNKTSPGCAVAVVRNDSVIFAKGYGMANLEYGVPITPETIFHTASLSKQFTAYAVVLLARQGKLTLDDDVRKHLQWFPDLKKKITILHLLHHTSGIRDQWQLLAISGTRLDDVITQEHIIKLLSAQKELNFTPGERYLYSNSGYTMLAEIVKSVSGQTFRAFCDSAIFKPLNMTSTHFHDNAEEIVKNRSYSYNQADSAKYIKSILSYSNAGATSLFTNANDFAKWISNYYRPVVGDQQDIKQLVTKGTLNSGKEIQYALGILSDKHQGWTRYSHGGADAGFRTFMSVYPDLKTGVIVFSNLGSFNVGAKANELIRLFVSDTAKNVDKADRPGAADQTVTSSKKKAENNKPDSVVTVIKDSIRFKKYAGSYVAEEGMAFTFNWKDSQLYVLAGPRELLLSKTEKDTFSVVTFPHVRFFFRDVNTSVAIFEGDQHFDMKRYTPDTSTSVQRLKQYTGTYYCPELNCRYDIKLRDRKLYLTHNKYEDAEITLMGDEHMATNTWWMNHMLVTRDGNKKITGFKVHGGRVLHLQFRKI